MVLMQGCQTDVAGDVTLLEKPEFVIESILSWLKHMGCKSYLQAGKLLIFVDAVALENICQPGFGTVLASCRKIQKITFRILFGPAGIIRPAWE